MLIDQQTVAFLTRISAKLLYGTIILMTVLGSSRDSSASNQTIILSAVFSLLAVALADTYAYTINQDMQHQKVSTWRDKWKVFRERSWVMGSTLVPIVFFGLALLGIVTQDAAFRLTTTVLLLVLFFFGVVTRRLSGGSLLQGFVAGGGAALLGLMVVEVKLWAKYLPNMGY